MSSWFEDLFDGAEIISVYTRADALADGLLIDVTETAKEAGIRWPVAVTSALWTEIVPNECDSTHHGQSKEGRLWDVLWLFRCEAVRTSGSRMTYPVLMVENGKHKTVTIKALVHPGDSGEPVITLMLEDED